MSDLTLLVEPLKREVAVPGEFDTTFASTSDDDLAATLGDGFAECQLDGFFPTMSLNASTFVVTPDISVAGGALVVLYAAVRMIRSQIRNLKSSVKYEAGGAIYEVSQAASVLVAELKTLEDRKKGLLMQILRAGRVTNGVTVMDGYIVRSIGYSPLAGFSIGELGGFYGYELSGIW